MDSRHFLRIAAGIILFCLCSHFASFSSGNEERFTLENGATFTLRPNQYISVKNIWKDPAFSDWKIRMKLKSCETQLVFEIISPTFEGREIALTEAITSEKPIVIQQGRGASTTIELKQLFVNRGIFSLTIQSASSSLELRDAFDIEIN